MTNRAESPCESCPSRTPFLADPGRIQRARDLCFEPPLDERIREFVVLLIAHGVETFESCEGGEGHSSPEPVVRFEGAEAEGLRAVAVAMAYKLPVGRLRRAWAIRSGSIHGPWWEMTFDLPPQAVGG